MERRHEVDLTWLPFDLHPEIPEGGVELDNAFGGRGQGYARQLRTQIAELGVTGTPSWLIGGLLVPGAQPRETFDRIIERMLERGSPD